MIVCSLWFVADPCLYRAYQLGGFDIVIGRFIHGPPLLSQLGGFASRANISSQGFILNNDFFYWVSPSLKRSSAETIPVLVTLKLYACIGFLGLQHDVRINCCQLAKRRHEGFVCSLWKPGQRCCRCQGFGPGRMGRINDFDHLWCALSLEKRVILHTIHFT